MARRTLIDFFDDLSGISGEFLVYDDGYRTLVVHLRDDRRRGARRSPRGCTPPASSRARRRRSGARTGRSGSSRSGAACSRRRPRADRLPRLRRLPARASPTSSTPAPCWSATSVDARRSTSRTRRSGSSSSCDRRAGDRPRRADRRDRASPPDDVAEIIFTSGATADRRASSSPTATSSPTSSRSSARSAKYRKYAQAVPADPVPEPAAAQPHVRPGDGDVRAADAARRRGLHAQLRAGRHRPADPHRRVSVLVCVPKILEVLRDHVMRRRAGDARSPPAGRSHWTARWWRYRRVHRLFGLKFWAIVVGAAPLDPELEAFWGRLGFVVVQGYGLTETAPIVTLNHPLPRHARRGRQADRRRRGARSPTTARSSCAART